MTNNNNNSNTPQHETTSPPVETRKRFRIEKLEERIAPTVVLHAGTGDTHGHVTASNGGNVNGHVHL